MHVGMTTFFQNLSGDHTDREVYQHELSMADMAEPLGFESIWTAEHHFDDYTMCPNPLQFLTYMAGRTERALLGTMVMVLPWHDPVRVAEEVAVLDHMSNGRAILGVGRGQGRIEFEGFRVNMGESRERFVEYTEALMQGLETGHIEYEGKFYKQPKIGVRPFPFTSFKGRFYASAVSPESSRIMARLGIGIMIIAQKPWDKTLHELEQYREIYREMNNGEEAPQPLMVVFNCCHEDESVANEMQQKYTRRYSRSALDHYEFNNEGLADIKGYEYYGGLSKNINKHGIDSFVNFLADLQVWGTPDQVFERMREYQEMTNCAGFINGFSFGGMPHEMAKTSMRTFADKVMPRLKAMDVGPALGGGQPLTIAAE